MSLPGDHGSAGEQEDDAGQAGQPAVLQPHHPCCQVLESHIHGHLAYQVGCRVWCHCELTKQ